MHNGAPHVRRLSIAGGAAAGGAVPRLRTACSRKVEWSLLRAKAMKPRSTAPFSAAGRHVISSEMYKGVFAEKGVDGVTVTVVLPEALVMVVVTGPAEAVLILMVCGKNTTRNMAYIVTK